VYENNNWNYKKDPINVFWYKAGGADTRMRIAGWVTALGDSQWVALWDNVHGGYWKTENYQLQDPNGQIDGTRIHLRLFGANYSDSVWGYWTITDAHKEHFDWNPLVLRHIIDSWEDAEWAVRTVFWGKAYVGAFWYAYLNNAGWFQNKYNDGWAPFIELKY